MDKLPLKKDFTFDFVLLLIVETPCLSYVSQNLWLFVGLNLFIELYFLLKKVGHHVYETLLIRFNLLFCWLYHLMFLIGKLLFIIFKGLT